MGLTHSPRIVTDGLVSAYDAANTKSYNGSPLTNWYSVGNGGANTNIWQLVGIPNAPGAVAADSTYGTWNGNTIFNATCTQRSSYYSATSIRLCIPASYNNTIGTARRLTFKVRMIAPNATAINNISYHNAGSTAGHISSNFTLLDESEVPKDSVFKDNWYLVERDVSGTFNSGHCVGIGLPNLHNQPIEFLFTELMMYSDIGGGEPQPFTPTIRSGTNAMQDMVGNNNGTINGTYQHNSDNKSIQFTRVSDTNGDHIAIGDDPSLDLETAWTIETWCKREVSISSLVKIVSKWENYFIATDNNKLYGCVGQGSAHDCLESANRTTTLPFNQWSHIMMTYAESTGSGTTGVARIYLNGVEINTWNANGTASSDHLLTIGCRHDNPGSAPDQFFGGKISVTRVYNRELTPAEVTQNFNALRGRYGI